jgi:hypothetical protein
MELVRVYAFLAWLNRFLEGCLLRLNNCLNIFHANTLKSISLEQFFGNFIPKKDFTNFFNIGRFVKLDEFHLMVWKVKTKNICSVFELLALENEVEFLLCKFWHFNTRQISFILIRILKNYLSIYSNTLWNYSIETWLEFQFIRI